MPQKSHRQFRVCRDHGLIDLVALATVKHQLSLKEVFQKSGE